jgi:hypothetical protein
MGDPAQVAVDEGNQLVEGRLVAARPLEEEAGDVCL